MQKINYCIFCIHLLVIPKQVRNDVLLLFSLDSETSSE